VEFADAGRLSFITAIWPEPEMEYVMCLKGVILVRGSRVKAEINLQKERQINLELSPSSFHSLLLKEKDT
jgi:hypothetical protein